ncbi:MAG TPA: AAA family ATPase [Ktedonobacterales bacterium]
MAENTVIRLPAEERHQLELDTLRLADTYPKLEGWALSPKMVATFIMGTMGKRASSNGGTPTTFKAADGRDIQITPKYIGDRALIEVAIATLASDRALLLVGEPGTAKCVKHDTLILDTRTGQRITIAEACRRRDLELASLQADYHLRPQAPTDFINNGIRPCFRVTTHLGREIEVTSNHPFLTIDGWRPLDSLQSGERIAVPRVLPFFGAAELSDAHVKILAHLIAEGCLTQNIPYHSNAHPEMQRDFSQAVQEAFPELEAYWYPDGRWCSVSGGKHGPQNRNRCTQWLRDLGLMGTNSGNKFVPEIVFSLPKRQIALFLNRLFSGDGFLDIRPTTQQITLDYASKSKQLTRDVQHLLLRFGINAKIRTLKTGHYRLVIYGPDACRTFLQEIGLIGRKNVEEALTLLSDRARPTNPNLDTIPFRVWEHLEQANISAGVGNAVALMKVDRTGAAYKLSRSTILRGQSLSRSRLLRLATLVADKDLQQLAQSDIYWDTIKSIEPIGNHEVYDLSMAETHNFVANDFIVHNSWLSEHLTAAISGTSRYVIQGTAGTTEDQIKYSWNYALLLAEGPSLGALVPSPMYRAMEEGKVVRFEELTRCSSEVQDGMLSILSEKEIAVPELRMTIPARRGFSVIATANTRDRGVNDMSSALKRRFNFVELPVPEDLSSETAIVEKRTHDLMADYKLESQLPADLVKMLVTIFQELRRGRTIDGKVKVKTPGAVLSTAEAISVLFNSTILAAHFGSGQVSASEVGRSLVGAVAKEDSRDVETLREYLETVVKGRSGKEWEQLYEARRYV